MASGLYLIFFWHECVKFSKILYSMAPGSEKLHDKWHRQIRVCLYLVEMPVKRNEKAAPDQEGWGANALGCVQVCVFVVILMFSSKSGLQHSRTWWVVGNERFDFLLAMFTDKHWSRSFLIIYLVKFYRDLWRTYYFRLLGSSYFLHWDAAGSGWKWLRIMDARKHMISSDSVLPPGFVACFSVWSLVIEGRFQPQNLDYILLK